MLNMIQESVLNQILDVRKRVDPKYRNLETKSLQQFCGNIDHPFNPRHKMDQLKQDCEGIICSKSENEILRKAIISYSLPFAAVLISIFLAVYALYTILYWVLFLFTSLLVLVPILGPELAFLIVSGSALVGVSVQMRKEKSCKEKSLKKNPTRC